MFGKIIFWLSWPLMWLMIPLTRQVRVVIVQDRKVLLIKNRVGMGRWDLPGGAARIGESAVDASSRKVKEELSLDCLSPKLLIADSTLRMKSGVLFRLQFVQADILEDSLVKKNWEISDFTWASEEELRELVPDSVAGMITGFLTSSDGTL